jgi:hypothetical protein
MQLKSERTKAKNYGAQLAKGDYVLFVDYNMVLQPDVARECVDECVKGTVGVIIPEAPIGKGLWVEISDLAWHVSEHKNRVGAVFYKHVLEVGSFDEDIITC